MRSHSPPFCILFLSIISFLFFLYPRVSVNGAKPLITLSSAIPLLPSSLQTDCPNMTNFGSTVAISPGSRLIAIGAPSSACPGGHNGVVSMWYPVGGTWSHLTNLFSPSASNIYFGSAISFVDDSVLLVGDYGDSLYQGVVYVFVCNSSGCSSPGSPKLLTSTQLRPGLRFGTSIACWGGWAAVTAPGAHGLLMFQQTAPGNLVQLWSALMKGPPVAVSMSMPGIIMAVGPSFLGFYIWAYYGTVWQQLGPYNSGSAFTPESVALSPHGQFATIGDSSNRIVQVFPRTDSKGYAWTDAVVPFIDPATEFSTYGVSVAMVSDDIAVVGSDYIDSSLLFYQSEPGSVPPQWPLSFKLHPPSSSSSTTAAAGQFKPGRFGCSIAVSPSYLLVGARATTQPHSSSTGAAFLYEVTHGSPISWYGVLMSFFISLFALGIIGLVGGVTFLIFRAWGNASTRRSFAKSQ